MAQKWTASYAKYNPTRRRWRYRYNEGSRDTGLRIGQITSRFDGVIKKLYYEPDDMAKVGKVGHGCAVSWCNG
jgi:hypothetical protein